MKKAPALLCTAALVVGLLPLSALAAETTEAPATIPIGTQQLISAPVQIKGGAELLASSYVSTNGKEETALHESAYGTDENGRITSVYTTIADGSEAKPAYYAYDADGRLLAYGSETPTDNIEDWAELIYTYNAEGRLQSVAVSYFEEATIYSDYDENGNPCTAKCGDEVPTTYTYDENGWIRSMTSGDASETYTRDSYGNITETKYEYKGTDPVVTRYTYTYDTFGNILTQSVTDEEEGITYTTAYTYSYENAATEPSTTSADPAPAVTPSATPTVMVSRQKLTVDGKDIACAKYNIDGANYFKLRDIASLLNGTGSQFGVGYDAATNTVTIMKNEAYTAAGGELEIGSDQSATAVLSKQTILIDGKEVTDLSVYNIGGSNYFKLRDLGEALGFGVDYNADTNTAVVTSADKE